MLNRHTIESTFNNLSGTIDVPLWMTPDDIGRYARISREIAAPDDDGEHPHFITRFYAPYVREWALTFTHPHGEIAIESLADVQAFGGEPPYQLVQLIMSSVKPAVDNFFSDGEESGT